MLELTILKVRHAGLGEVRKIEPYVQQCDVLAPENAMFSEAESRNYENLMQRLYTLSLTAFRKTAEELSEKGDPAQKEYRLKFNEFLFKGKKPIYCLERFTPTESFYLKSKKSREIELFATSKVLFGRNDIDAALQTFFQGLCLVGEEVRMRDEHIAKTLEKAEAEIRQRYASLRTKNPLRLAMQIGGLHFPERFIDTSAYKTAVVDLNPRIEKDPSADIIKTAYDRKANFDEARNKLVTAFLISVKKLTHEEAATKTYDELQAMIVG